MPTVSSVPPVHTAERADGAARPRFSRRTALLGTENAFRIGPQIQALERAGHHVVRCNLGEPDFPLPAHVADEVKRQIDLGQTHYCDPQGILPLREAIAHTMGRRRNITITPDRVVVFPGAKPPIGFAQEAYCDPGDEVVYPSPGFPVYESFTAYLGAVAIPLHLRESMDFTFTGADLESLLTPRTRLVILNFPSNPTGGVATSAQLAGIAEAILKKAPQARVYSDEVYEDIVFEDVAHQSIASLPGMAERTIIVGGVSKSYAWTGGRVGWAVFPTAEEAAVFRNLNINYFSCVPAYNQWGAKVALESPESAAAIARMVAAFRERRDLLVAGLNAIDGIHCRMPRGAFYVFPNIARVCDRLGATDAWRSMGEHERGGSSPSTWFQSFLLHRHHVATLDRRSFGRIGCDDQHYLRISFATGMDELRQALERIGAATVDRKGFQAFLREGPSR